MQVKQRTIESGDIKELLNFKYPLPIMEHRIFNPFGRNGTGELISHKAYLKKQQDNRLKTLKRNTSKLWRLYNCNKNKWKYTDKFMTLTFRTLPSSITEADYELKKFIQRLKYFSKSKPEYLGVRELQMEFERNGIHFHLIIFNMPYIPHSDLLKLWCKNNPYMDSNKASGVNIMAIKDGYEEMSNYLTSYQLKDIVNNDFIKGHKTLIRSKGLMIPVKQNYTETIFLPKMEDIKKGLSFLDNKVTYYRLK